MKSIIRLISFSLFLYSQILAAETLFSLTENRLLVPHIKYQGTDFRAEFKLINAGQIQLSAIAVNQHLSVYNSVVEVDEALNFTVNGINIGGALYDAKIEHFEDDVFNIAHVQASDLNVAGRGEMLQINKITELTREQIIAVRDTLNAHMEEKVELQIEYPIAIYTMRYQSVDPAGQSTPVSALLVLPIDAEKRFPLLAYQHQTLLERVEAPSQKPLDFAAIGFATGGYAVIASDYLGLGDSTLLHPYVHAQSLANSVIDGVRAARSFFVEQSYPESGQLFLAGYSEGGYATMAAHRMMQQNYPEEFTVTASAPMAGPYDLSDATLNFILKEEDHPNPYYVPYLILPYQQIYEFNAQTEPIFSADYPSTLAALYDGSFSSKQINDQLPSVEEYFDAAFLQAVLANQALWLHTALKANDVYRWNPTAPMYLLHCPDDNQVPFQNSQTAYEYFIGQGNQRVELIAIDSSELEQDDIHFSCAVPAIMRAKEKFDQLLSP